MTSKTEQKAFTKAGFYQAVEDHLSGLRQAKTYKLEVPVEGRQGPVVKVNGKDCVMLASNNYLGLANHPRILAAAAKGLEEHGFGMASVRFICGTQPIHRQLEERIASFVGCEDAILHSSCYEANEAFFHGILGTDFGLRDYRDAIYSDELNHASIIDGIRLCRISVKTTDAKPYQYNNVEQLSQFLDEDISHNYRLKVIATDGVFSMEGHMARLKELIDLSNKHQGILFVDESHSTGVLGKSGRGTAEELDVFGKIDVISGTLGKALGGAAGGFIAGRKCLIDFLRQKSRPYTFSNTVPPPIVYAALEAINMLEEDRSLIDQLRENTQYFRNEIKRLGFTILDGIHPIVPVMLGEAATAMDASSELLNEGVYVRGLWYPVVPKGKARLRVQISAAHSKTDLDKALSAFEKVGKKLGVI